MDVDRTRDYRGAITTAMEHSEHRAACGCSPGLTAAIPLCRSDNPSDAASERVVNVVAHDAIGDKTSEAQVEGAGRGLLFAGEEKPSPAPCKAKQANPSYTDDDLEQLETLEQYQHGGC